MSSPRTRRFMPASSVVAAAVALAACNGSSGGSSGSATLASQAIDGYIVGATVMCDGVENGATADEGRFTCPSGTTLAKVRGGEDVGFNTDESDDRAFVGELVAPATLGFVTPLSSIAVAMSGGEDGFDASAFAGSVQTMGEVLGFSGLDLGADPSRQENVALAALNAKINQIKTGFAPTADDYGIAGAALASLITSTAQSGGRLDTTQDVRMIMEAMNDNLPAGSPLRLDAADLDSLIAAVAQVNQQIDAAPSPADISLPVSKSPIAAPALTLVRDQTLLRYRGADGAAPLAIDLDSFESEALGAGGQYATVIDGSGELSIEQGGFMIGTDLANKPVDLGFALRATGEGDERRLSVATAAALVSATEGDSGSLSVTIPAGSIVYVASQSMSGVGATATITLENAHSFALDNGDVDVSFWRISDELRENGLDDITRTAGNYRMTVAVGGVRIEEVEDGERRVATSRSVTAGSLTVTGPGYRGFVSFVPDAP